ncbi:MAG: hypothetical protein M1817_003828 [Caeruleum heppii]|nr:MAG: hypothetical protein M1817_003828 [Caeruleum heppii]
MDGYNSHKPDDEAQGQTVHQLVDHVNVPTAMYITDFRSTVTSLSSFPPLPFRTHLNFQHPELAVLLPQTDFPAVEFTPPNPIDPTDLCHTHHHLAQAMQQPMPSDEELAHLQKLSNEHHFDAEGPLVGPPIPSTAITAEYVQADPVYIQKTAALPQTYSHYRTIQGDGNCGWRAVAFSYFETLLRLGDKHRILDEETRLKSLNNLLSSFGYEEHLYEDFVEETVTLLKLLANSVPSEPCHSMLLQQFNDPGVSSAIITHFRLLTSAWMKAHAASYQPFILEESIDQYCAVQIEPYQVEIEHIGMNALIDILLKPAGIAVEILYLDRSPGAEVNSHRFEAVDSVGLPLNMDALTIRLLYRPGHYDILYKPEDVDFIVPQTHVEFCSSYRTAEAAAQIATVQTSSIPVLSSVPGYSYATSTASPLDPGDTPLRSVALTSYAAPMASSSILTFPYVAGTDAAVAEAVVHPEDLATFRPSKYEYEGGFSPAPPAPPVAPMKPWQTPTFRNSHFNPAHFRNSDFQPELWTPESDEADSEDDE